jgi:hypothetical protein
MARTRAARTLAFWREMQKPKPAYWAVDEAPADGEVDAVDIGSDAGGGVDVSTVGARPAGNSMRMVRVEVAVRPVGSVAT